MKSLVFALALAVADCAGHTASYADGEIVGWFYSATGDYQEVVSRGPFSSYARCEKHRDQYVPSWWESTGCKLRAINEGDEEDFSPIYKEA